MKDQRAGIQFKTICSSLAYRIGVFKILKFFGDGHYRENAGFYDPANDDCRSFFSLLVAYYGIKITIQISFARGPRAAGLIIRKHPTRPALAASLA